MGPYPIYNGYTPNCRADWLHGCSGGKPCRALPHRKLQKHGAEMARMRGREHRELIPLVEIALAIMRLSCEKFFVLISVLASYLIFRDDVPRSARLLIRLNHKLSTLFQRVRLACPIMKAL